MKYTLTLLAALLLAPLVSAIAPAANMQVQPNAWIKVGTDRADAIYKVGETAIFRVSVESNAPGAVGELSWSPFEGRADGQAQSSMRLTWD